jgi:putative endonuclease
MIKKLKSPLKITSYSIGIITEFLTIVFLIFKGYRVLHWRYKTKLGEIDIIATKHNIIHIIEVKYRSSSIMLENLVRHNQIKRIKNSYLLFSKLPKYQNFEVNFDLITIEKWGKITHYKKHLA